MIPLERENQLLALLKQEKSMTVNELAAKLYVSPMTMRRDLKVLENQGLVIRNHGRVEIVQLNITNTSNYSYALRKTVHLEEKRRAAAAAFECIRPGETIFIDDSSTTGFLTEWISADMKLTVVTNSPKVTNLLSRKGVRVCCTGGRYTEYAEAFFGSFAELSARFFEIDAMFFSALGFVPGDGIYNSNEDETSLLRAYMERSKRKYFLGDPYKLGKKYIFRLCGMENIDGIFYDMDSDAGNDRSPRCPAEVTV